MGMNYYKKEFSCGGECEMCGCGKKSTFYMRISRTCDIGDIFYKHDINDSELEHIGCFHDSAIYALGELIKNTEPNAKEFSDTEMEQVRKFNR